jgi:ABC-type glutathione transport system ATPase component
MKGPVLSLKGLTICLKDGSGPDILKDVSFDVPSGGCVGVVGGSGSGKTTLGLAGLGMLAPAMQRSGGVVLLEGRDIFSLPPEEKRRIRSRRVAMIFQEPLSAFDPLYTVGEQIQETILAHEPVSRARARDRVKELLRLAEIRDPVRVAASHPHFLSGGLLQRAMIAMALSLGPGLLIADEPTSSLDVITQARLLVTLERLKKELGLAILLITHDLGVVRHLAEELVILCRGEVVEKGRTGDVMSAPSRPYTRELLEAEGGLGMS